MRTGRTLTRAGSALLAAVLALTVSACEPKQKAALTLNETRIELEEGETFTLTAEATGASGTVEWVSSDESVAAVSNEGVVTGLAAGTASVTAAVSGLSASCAVTVTARQAYSAVVEGDVEFSYFRELNALQSLDVVSYDFGNSKSSQQGEAVFGELVTLSVLQGLTARAKGMTSGVYLLVNEGGVNENAPRTWLEELAGMSGAAVRRVENDPEKPAWLAMAEKYSGAVSKTESGKPGFVLFRQSISDSTDADGNPVQRGEQNVNAACTVSAATGYLAVDERGREALEALGYELAVDARDWDEVRSYNEYRDALSDDIIMLTSNGQPHNRDYGVAAKAFFMYESNKDDAFMNEIASPSGGKYKPGTLAVGWSSTGEVAQVNRHASYGFNFTCTNYSFNLSQFARLGSKCFRQRAKDTRIAADPSKKYVALVMTDGDNITWHQNDFPFSEGWYGYPNRGNFKMGYTMAPLMADLAPNIVKREYEQATARDYFVCGVSGSGYVYPSEYGSMNAAALQKLAHSTGEYMRRADLQYVEILDNRPFDKDVLEAYAAEESVQGGIVLANYDYYKQGGDVRYYNGKPFVGVGEAMWSDTPGRVAHRLNSLPVDTTSANGYTLVKVHCWTTSMADVARMVSLLDDNVEIVSPGELMRLIADNVPENSSRTARPDTDYPADVDEYVDPQYFWDTLPVNEKTEFHFDTYLDYEGWQKYIGSKQYDNVSFSGEPWRYGTGVRTSEDGGAGYSVRLDGSDYGNWDASPNAAIYAKLRVPDSEKASFRFFVRGEAYGFDADYRVRVISNATGTPALTSLNEKWTEAGDDLWREVAYDVSAYRGEELVFIIEQNATDREGDGEILYVDNIRIAAETEEIAQIKRAKTNPETHFSFDTDAQGWASLVANGGAASYDNVRGALKSTVSAQNREWGGADALWYTRFDLASFKDFTHAKFGVWAAAEPGKRAQVRLATISADGKQILRASSYVTVDDTPRYLSLQLDTYRIAGGAFRYGYVLIEARGAGGAASVTFDNADFAPMARDVAKGYYYDAEYLQRLPASDLAALESGAGWHLQAGRGLEDTAERTEAGIRLYGYDFMRGSDTAVASKALKGYAKVANEFNARIYARLDSEKTELAFTAARVEKTLAGQTAVAPQLRALFLCDDGSVIPLSDFVLLNGLAPREIRVDLTAAAGRSGVLMIELDCAQNGDRAGAVLSGFRFT